MLVEVNGTRLWFDVAGPALVPDGPRMRERPQVVLVHGGPGSYDHSYLKPDFTALTDVAQVVYLDLRGHGRSERDPIGAWSFERCADDVRAFCDVVGIARPVVLGHSMGGIVAMLYGARHPDHPGGLVLLSTLARFDLDRLVQGFRSMAGENVAALAERDYRGDPVTDEEGAAVFAAFGPRVPSAEQLARRIRNDELGTYGMDLFRRLDAVGELARIRCPTLVCVGALDPVTPVGASQEIADALPPGLGRLEVIAGAGHFPWLDRPERHWQLVTDFVASTGSDR
jgi:pimeloyl-ACP methyl ester carboxylesterase